MKKYLAEIIWLFLLVYLILSVMPAFLMSQGYDNEAIKIHSLYRAFCHQRVERSMFLFGEEDTIAFYSRDELRELEVIPDENPYAPEAFNHDIYGYPYVGNDEIGFKMALCIRDFAIYVAVVVTGGIYLLFANITGKIRKYPWPLFVILMLPMAIDGLFQLFAEIMRLPWVPDAYFASIWKRIITGGLFGVGFALLVFSNVKESGDTWYNSRNKGRNNSSDGAQINKESKNDKSKDKNKKGGEDNTRN